MSTSKIKFNQRQRRQLLLIGGLIIIAIIIILIVRYQQQKRQAWITNRVKPEYENATSAADIPLDKKALFGQWQGTFPCSDCQGIETNVRLYQKNDRDQTPSTYQFIQTYLGSERPPLLSTGQWLIENGQYILTPDDGSGQLYFQPQADNQLQVLTNERRPVQAPGYVLAPVAP